MRPSRHLTLVLALLALLALAVAGCGGGGGGTTDTTAKETTEATPSLSKEELIKQGDGICAETNAAIGSVGSSAADPSSQTTQVANLYTGMVSNLEQLGQPTEGAAEYAKFMQAAEELAKIEGEVKLAAEREDTTALGEAATEAAPALEEFETQAGVFGFEECSKEPTAPAVAPSTSGSSEGELEEGGIEPEGEIEEVVPEEEFVPEEEVAPETGGAGGGIEEVAPEGGGGEESSSGGGVGPG
ncbi:MAG: hypothetical protein QOE56_2466 [Solirubrobacterales bacterium]|jgi:hypothetical protein|nr:hypothetical protein [Solirubrobacterales bacterium]